MSYRTRLLTTSLFLLLVCNLAVAAGAQETTIEEIPIGKGSYEEAAVPEGEGSLAEEVVPECGNGRIEAGEQCDPATRTEAYANFCDDQCQLILPPALTDCYRQEYSQCRRDKSEESFEQGPAKVSPGVRGREDEEIPTETDPPLDQACVDQALEVCVPEAPESIPQPPAQPVSTGGEESAVVPAAPGFEVSGSGCSLQGMGRVLDISPWLWGFGLVGGSFLRRRR